MSYPSDNRSVDTTSSGVKLSGMHPAAGGHIAGHNQIENDLRALRTKVGINGDSTTTSLDYKLSGVTGTDKAASLTGSETLTNKTLTAPKMANNDALTAKDSGASNRTVFKVDTNNILQISDDSLKGVNFRSGCFLKLPSAQSIATGASTDLAFGSSSELFDPLGMHDTVTNNARITLPVAGTYELHGMVVWADSTSGTYRIAGFFANGSSIITDRATKDSAGRASNTVYAIYTAAANDYVTIQAQQDTGGALNAAQAFFSARLVGV